MKNLFIALAQVILITSTLAQNASPEMDSKQKRVFRGITYEQTFVENIQGAYQENFRAAFITADAQYRMNTGGCKPFTWCSAEGNEPMPEDLLKTLRIAIYTGAMDALKPISIGQPKSGTMLLISAIECPNCLMLEKTLSKNKYGYYLMPTYLDKKNRSFASDVFCDKNPSKAWADIMHKRVINANTDPACVYRDKEVKQLSALSSGVYPTAIFPDGSVVFGAEPIAKKLGLKF